MVLVLVYFSLSYVFLSEGKIKSYNSSSDFADKKDLRQSNLGESTNAIQIYFDYVKFEGRY